MAQLWKTYTSFLFLIGRMKLKPGSVQFSRSVALGSFLFLIGRVKLKPDTVSEISRSTLGSR